MLQLLAIIIAAFGLGIGIFFGYFIREEVSSGKKYLELARFILFILIIASFLYFFRNDWKVYITASILLVIQFTKSKNSGWIYAALGIVVGISSVLPEAFFTNSLLIFLIGIPIGMLKNKNQMKKTVKSGIIDIVIFLIISITLYFSL